MAENTGGGWPVIDTSLVGAPFAACYWDTDRSLDKSAGGIGKATAEMMGGSTFADWDFTGVWRIDEGESYPYFAWQGSPAVSIFHKNRVARNRAGSSMPQVSVKGRTLNVKLPSAQSPSNLKISLIDMRGRTIHSRVVNGNANTLSLTKIPAGRYIVEVKNGGVRVGSVPVVVR